jgi:3-hydroxypropanoate dehydrogenase
MAKLLDDEGQDLLFREARSHGQWLSKEVADDVLRRIYELMKWGPTSGNCCPARFVFLRTKQAKERLRPLLMPMNVEKTMSAPLTAIVAYDLKFYDQIPRLFPHNPNMRDYFVDSRELTQSTAQRNSAMQGAYFILAARALGLDCGPMSGFDNAALDREFFPDGQFKSNFLCNLGYGAPEALFPRNPRLAFEEACTLL